MTTLGDLMVVRGGSVNPSSMPDEEFELYSIPAHDRGGPELVRGSDIGSSKQLVQPNDVMISKIIPHIRRARIVGPDAGKRQIASGEWIVFRDRRMDPNYLRHFLLSDGFHTQFMSTVAGVGGSLVRARPQHVKAIEVPVVSLGEQRRIAAILDHADALRTRRRQVLAHLDALTQSIFHEMFRFWEGSTLPLGELVVSQLIGLDRGAMAQGADREHEYVKMNAISPSGALDLSSLTRVDADMKEVLKYSLSDGDVILNTRNSKELVGKTAVYRGDPILYNNNLVRLRFDGRVLPDFVHQYFWSPEGKQQLERRKSGTTSVYAIYGKTLMTVMLPVPPIQMQCAFADRVRRIEGQKGRCRKELEISDRLFAALQSRAFKGDL